jgi:hypothetical protein
MSFSEPSLRLWVDGVKTESDTVSLGGMPVSFDSLTVSGTGTVDEVSIAQTAVTTDDAADQGYCPL